MKGRVIKNQNGYFSIWTASGNLHLCRSRGRLKRKTDILVGDEVEFELTERGDAAIISVSPRRNALARPPVANIDCLVLTVAIRTPDVNLYTLDKMLLLAENADIPPVLCVNKADLAPEAAETLAEIYKKAGYKAVCVSAASGEGISALEAALDGKITAFSGPSGVGKSSLLNRLLGRTAFTAGAVSDKTGRGKNTTRHAELVPFKDNAFLMDTPGYTSLELETVAEENLGFLFKDFRPYLGGCRFNDCLHLSEPDCAVRSAAEAGQLAESRYRSYRQAVEEIRAAKGKW